MIRVALPFGKTPDGKRNPYRRALNAVDVQPVESAATLAISTRSGKRVAENNLRMRGLGDESSRPTPDRKSVV